MNKSSPPKSTRSTHINTQTLGKLAQGMHGSVPGGALELKREIDTYPISNPEEISS